MNELSRMRVDEVMTRDVHTLDSSTPFKAIVNRMAAHRVSAFPVVDGDGRVLGVVSEADLLLKECHLRAQRRLLEPRQRRVERAKSHAVTAGELMTSPAITVSPETLVTEAAQSMHERRVKRLVVVDQWGHLVGIVTRGDVLRVFLRQDDDIRVAVTDVAERLLWLDGRDLSIAVTDGVVTLEGRLDRRSNVDLLAGLCEELDGVVAVVNRLTFDWDDARPEPVPSPVPPHYSAGVR